jgi:outer membrane protein
MGSRQRLFPTGYAVKVFLIATLIGGLVSVSPTSLANDASATTWGLGLGARVRQEPYKDIDRDTLVIPLLQVENRYFRFWGTTLEAKLPGLTLNETNELDFSLIARWDGSGYETDDAWVFEGMDDRDGGIWAGAKAEWRTGLVNLGVDWTHDVFGNSKGQRLTLQLDRSWRLGEHLVLTPRIGAIWHDRRYVDYYYGVEADEVRTRRPAYQGESGVSPEVGLRGLYRFNKHHAMMLDIQATGLPAEIKDSPLVDRSTDNRVFLGYMYLF